MKEFRDWLGIIVIVISIIALVYVGAVIISKGDNDDYQLVYSSLLPLVGTWVGVVLAFYFGKENYEAASNRFEKIIDKLTPEILDDVQVNQVMIVKKTMVAKKWKDIEDKSIKEIIDFLAGIEKTRLPVIGDDNRVLYIIHDSLLLKTSSANTEEKISAFVEKNKGVVDKIVWAKERDILENIRKLMNSETNCKDVFIENTKGELVGWLTDTLILRFINSNKL
ncbi:MAG: hypothetical protein ABJM36_04735 [Algibacter sp.]|uniref:hypothetical protein n=1 Tax=Algibacter sp. TaxID=1872428 RepID=UPI003297B7F1